MERDDAVYLQHILDAISRIEEYLHGIDEEAFQDQHLVQDGIIRQLEIIGEATKRLSHAVRGQSPHIPWQDIRQTPSGAWRRCVFLFYLIQLFLSGPHRARSCCPG
ncbi:MAG: DUF86 domain-containing protein [Anaerolineae bacterium]|nr:DUF86 domain-containing protein [Anaerolineae bacterium]